MDDQPVSLTRPAEHKEIDAAILEELINLYLERQYADGVISLTTQRNYRIQLRPFLEYWRACPHEHHYRLSRDILRRSLEWVRSDFVNTKGTHPAYSTVEDCYVRLRTVFSWLFVQNCTGTSNLSHWCPDIRHVDPDQYYPTLPEVERLMMQPTGENRLRDVTIMAFLISTAARRLEAALATVGDLEFLTSQDDLTLGHDHRGTCHLRVTKGDREGVTGGRHVVFCSEAGLLLKAYLRSVRRPDSERIFALSDSGLGKVIRRHTANAGMPEISPHAFRRLFSDYWAEHKPELERLRKQQLGHSLNSQDVTERRYTNHKNKRRATRLLLEHHISPLREMNIDWRTLPVHIPGGD